MPTRTSYRLGLVGFADDERRQLTAMTAQVTTSDSSWSVATEMPYDALLLIRGSREGDPPDCAVLRLVAATQRWYAEKDRRADPVFLRRPISQEALRVALTGAVDRLRSAPGR